MSGLLSSISNDVLIVDFEETRILDQESVDSIGGELLKIAASTEFKKILLDMNRIELMTSTMIGQFVLFNKKCREKSIDVRMCNLTSEIKDLFKITKLDSVFKIADHRQDALSSLE